MSDLLVKLRETTREAHEDLEARLDLLREPLRRDRYLEVLERFYGFHAVWDDAISPWSAYAGHDERGVAVKALRRDIAALGGSALSALPRCSDAARLAADRETAIGSLYVMEGSALGGKVINRAVTRAAWSPPGGLMYFDRYGAATGAVWRRFGERARAAATLSSEERIVSGALATFALLAAWLPLAEA